MRLAARNIPTRLVTGAYILHSGWQKWRGDEETAQGLHGFAVSAYPFLSDVPPTTFLKALATAELSIGAALLLPIVPNRLAGALLSGFSGALLGLYWRAPSLREPGSIWPTQSGIALSKDIWMFGISLELLADPGT